MHRLRTWKSSASLGSRRSYMSKHKKQHYIPVSYLKAWCDENCPATQAPYIWIFDVDGTKPKKKAPENVLHETNMYTITQTDGGRNLVLEHGLRELEDKFCRIRRTMLRFNKQLAPREGTLLCAFMAAMYCRTPAMRDHWQAQWGSLLDRMGEMRRWMDSATEEERERASSIPDSSSASEDALSEEDVRNLHQQTLQRMLPSMMSTITPFMVKMNIAILNAPKDCYFLTSDNPCVLFDPDGHKRPPFYRSPGWAYPKIEVTLPISPNQMVFLNKQGVGGYRSVNRAMVDELNRRTRFHAYRSFICNKNETNPCWFNPGVEPEDSWEKTHPSRNRRHRPA